uniref:BHLH domain-containing protein n=1 Tax=Heterorhabditis bacteriophora TaxID=37862 RepID=A0A1I7WSF2_HETBA
MTRSCSTASSSSPDDFRRLRSTLKEKKRNVEINQAFENLQRQLPHVPTSTRLPKIKTLRLALKYIEHLNSILNGDKQASLFFIAFIMSNYMNGPRPLCIDDFAAVAMQEIQVRNSYTDRAKTEEGLASSVDEHESSGGTTTSCSTSSQDHLRSPPHSAHMIQNPSTFMFPPHVSTQMPPMYMPSTNYSHYHQQSFWQQ